MNCDEHASLNPSEKGMLLHLGKYLGNFSWENVVVIFIGKYLSAKNDGSAVVVDVVVLHEKNAEDCSLGSGPRTCCG